MQDYTSKAELTKPNTKMGIFAWCVFDWAHSAFPTVIITFIFGTYFIRSVADSVISGTAYWGWSIGVSGIIIAILSPILGSIADNTGRRKPWLFFFVIVNVIFTALLFFTQPSPSWIWYALVIIVIAEIAYEMTQLFYNSMMVPISSKKNVGRISGWGWGLGYVGGLVCLAIALFVFIKAPWITKHHDMNIRLTTLLVAVWFFVFSLPLFFSTSDVKRTNLHLGAACGKGMRELWTTLKELGHYKWIFTYFLAHLIYIDGLNTVLAFGGIFAAGTFHMDYTQILIFAILLNLTAAIGAVAFAWVDDWLGAKFTICFSLFAMMLCGIVILLIHSIFWFWIMAAILGIFVGPTQAASRSYMARITPKHLINQMFGIYQFSGRITAFIGPILVGTFTEVFKSQRGGMAVTFIMILIGFLIMLVIPGAKKLAKLYHAD